MGALARHGSHHLDHVGEVETAEGEHGIDLFPGESNRKFG